jgi:hypothetical protein
LKFSIYWGSKILKRDVGKLLKSCTEEEKFGSASYGKQAGLYSTSFPEEYL